MKEMEEKRKNTNKRVVTQRERERKKKTFTHIFKTTGHMRENIAVRGS